MPPNSDPKDVVLARRAFLSCALIGLTACGGGGGDGADPNGQARPSGNSPPGPAQPTPPSAPAPGAPTPIPSSPAPVPPPEPLPPPPTPVSFDPRIAFQSMAMSKMVIFESYHESSRYERYRRLHVLSGDRVELQFKGFDFTSGGNLRALSGSTYRLLVDEAEVSSTTVTPGTTTARFDVDLTSITPGWHKLSVGGLTAGETCPAWYVFVRRGSVGEQPFTPVVMGTYELIRRSDFAHAVAIAPGAYRPSAKPVLRRTYENFTETLRKDALHCMQLIPLREGDIHRPNRNPDGILSAFDRQSYFWSDLVAVGPRIPLLDGPRGVGTLAMATHVEVGRGPRGNIFACDPWRMVRIAADGTVTTLVGHRHRSPASHWEDPADLELIGDWSAVPADRRGFHELWGFAWDERTLVINEAAPPIPAENNEKPHIVAPVVFLADSQNDRIIRVEFNATAHGVPPKVTEFITGILDPWDVVFVDGTLYVTERKSHRIAAYDATTGAYIKTIVQGSAFAAVDRLRIAYLTGTLAQAQASPCVAPEGLYHQDGWLYFASKAQAQVRRVNIATGEVAVVCPIRIDGNSNFAKIAVSDGTFGPRGTVFIWTWSANNLGYPETILPDGTSWIWFREDVVGAGQWGKPLYPCAGAVSQGRLVTASVDEGLLVISKRQAGDVVASDAVNRGAAEYKRQGFHLLYGEHGFGFYGLALPYGHSADIDAYLNFHGHTAGFA